MYLTNIVKFLESTGLLEWGKLTPFPHYQQQN